MEPGLRLDLPVRSCVLPELVHRRFSGAARPHHRGGAYSTALTPNRGHINGEEDSVVPAGGSQDVSVLLSTLGLDDGIHQAEIHLTSNDPYNPDHVVPVTLNVSLVEPAHVDFEPDVVYLGASGNTVKMVVELPSGLDPYAVDPCSVLLNDAVPVLGCPGAPAGGAVEFTDEHPEGGNGIEEVSFKFDRDTVYAVLGEENPATVWIQGEVTDIQWWRGSATVGTIVPYVTSPGLGQYFVAGQTVPIRWDPVSWTGPVTYTVQLTRDDGATWTDLAAGLAGNALDWSADSSVTDTARVRVLALDDTSLLLGFDESDGNFTLGGPTLTPPHAVDGSRMQVAHDNGVTTFTWEWPRVPLTHGPASGFRVLSGSQGAGSLAEVDLVDAPAYQDGAAVPQPGEIIFFRFVATNAAGDAD